MGGNQLVIMDDYAIDVGDKEGRKRISCLRKDGRVVFVVPDIPFCEAVRRIWWVIGQVEGAQKLIRAG